MRAAMVVMLMMLGCGDQRPCTSCPSVIGAYLVSWQSGLPSMGCPTEGPRPQNFNLTQVGSTASLFIGGEALRGTLYDTYDFQLIGGRGELVYSLRGRAVVGSSADGGTPGVRLVGTLFTRTMNGCELGEPYTADRI